jgi:hypothetical protein
MYMQAVCNYTSTHVYIHTCMYAYVCMYTYIQDMIDALRICICKHAFCSYTPAYAYILTCIYAYIQDMIDALRICICKQFATAMIILENVWSDERVQMPRFIVTGAFVYVCMYVYMYVCMYTCMYVRIHVCMYVYEQLATAMIILENLWSDEPAQMPRFPVTGVCVYVCMYVCMCVCSASSLQLL